MPRWLKVCLVVLVLLVAGLAATVAVVWAKLPDIAASFASKAAGRTVTIGSLKISPGWWLGVELHDARLANLPGGTRPDMATLASLTGEVELMPLLHGTVIARSVQVQGGDILLEKIGPQPNWRNGPKPPEQPGGGRAHFPTLLGADLDGVVTFRTTSGHALVTKLNGVKVEATAADQPIRIVGPGSYQDAPVALDLKLGSYDQLHDVATPFPADVQLTSGDTVVHFNGTMTKPLDVDGADGQLSLVAPTPTALEKVSGVDPSPGPPLRIAGPFTHEKNLWKLQQAKGALGDASIEDGTLQLQEGNTDSKTPDVKADKVDVALRFAELNLDRLLASFQGGSATSGASGFVPQPNPNPLITAKLEAASLTYQKFRFIKPTIPVSVEPGLIKLDAASFGALGGQIRLDGQIRAADTGDKATATAALTATGLEVAQLREAFATGQLPLVGRLDIRAVADGTGSTAAAALKSGRASVVATMRDGGVSAQLVELASTDVAGLFRSSRDVVPLNCLLVVMDVRGGTAEVSPVRLRSAQGTIVARGQIDLLRQTMDVVVASEAKTTGLLALDVPVRVTGRIDDPSIAPAGAKAGQAARAIAPINNLPEPLRATAQRSGCAG